MKGIVSGGGLPVVGTVAAGQPVLAEENIDEYVAVPDAAGGARASTSCGCAGNR